MRQLLLISICLAMNGCFVDYSQEGLHKNFLLQYRLPIGHDIRNYYHSLPSGVLLKNGLIETQEKLPRRDCFVYYQYDPKTFIVKSWRWEGTECVAAS